MLWKSFNSSYENAIYNATYLNDKRVAEKKTCLLKMGFGTSALLVAIGTMCLIFGIELIVVSLIYKFDDDEHGKQETLIPNGNITYRDLRLTSIPLLAIGIPATILGYTLWYVYSKRRSKPTLFE